MLLPDNMPSRSVTVRTLRYMNNVHSDHFLCCHIRIIPLPKSGKEASTARSHVKCYTKKVLKIVHKKRSALNGPTYTCRVCKRIQTLRNIAHHMKTCAVKQYSCPACKFVPKTKKHCHVLCHTEKCADYKALQTISNPAIDSTVNEALQFGDRGSWKKHVKRARKCSTNILECAVCHYESSREMCTNSKSFKSMSF